MSASAEGASPPLQLVASNRKVLPHNADAERSVIGGILVHPAAFGAVRLLVAPGDFYNPTLASIFEAMTALEGAGKPIDEIHVAAQMHVDETYGKLKAVGGEAFFGELTSAVVTVENIAHHAGLVRSKARRRRITEAAHEIAARGYQDDDDDEFAADAERQILAVTQEGAKQSYRHAKLGAREAALRYEKTTDEAPGLATGFLAFDDMTGGLRAGHLSILAARPSMGKTALAMNIVQHVAIGLQVPVLVLSLEMSEADLLDRLVSAEGGVSGTLLQRPQQLAGVHWRGITKALGRVGSAPLWISDCTGATLREVRAMARAWRTNPEEGAQVDRALLVIDYLQLMSGDGKRRDDNREREISEISRGLKALAKELRLPVLALSQLNRGVESREKDKRPRLSDLRESGAIEQDADLIAFIYRDEVYNKQSSSAGTAEIIIGKQRTGAIGTVRLGFAKQYTRFENLSDERQQELDVEQQSGPPVRSWQDGNDTRGDDR